VIGYQGAVNEIRMVLCTFPEVAVARQIGTVLVEKQLAACVNLIPAVESIYRWQGRTETSPEVLAIFKTSAAAYPAFERALTDLHPYEVPEIVAFEPAAVAENYGSWLRGSLVIAPEKTAE
jgi:periplasmic divalent cation tolerance protein